MEMHGTTYSIYQAPLQVSYDLANILNFSALKRLPSFHTRLLLSDLQKGVVGERGAHALQLSV